MPKTQKCKVCKNEFERKRPMQSVCGLDCAKIDAKNKEVKKFQKEWNKESREKKEKNKTVSNWKVDLQKEINAIARLIDKSHGCIATGALTGKANAGHRTAVAANDSIRFNLYNIYLQSEHSNKWKAGDNIRYDEGLIRTFGQEHLDYVKSLSLTPPIHLSIPEIKEKIKIARKIVKELKDANEIYTTKQRLELRERYNKELGIYS